MDKGERKRRVLFHNQVWIAVYSDHLFDQHHRNPSGPVRDVDCMKNKQAAGD